MPENNRQTTPQLTEALTYCYILNSNVNKLGPWKVKYALQLVSVMHVQAWLRRALTSFKPTKKKASRMATRPYRSASRVTTLTL